MTSRMRLAGSAALLAAGILSSAGARAADTHPLIGLAVANLQANFFNQIKQSVTREAALRGAQVLVVDAHGDSATQVSQIQDLLTRGVKALIYIPAGATAAGVPVQAAEAAHVPVIAVDRNPPNAPATTFIATDSVAAARTLGDDVCKDVGGKGTVAIIQGQIGTTPQVDRSKGFKEALDACPGLTVVARQPSQEWSQAEGFSIAQDMLQRHPDISVFWGQADALALGAIQAIKVAHPDHKIMVVGFDGDPAGLKAVADGRMAATMTQKTQLMGKMALDSALALIDGRTEPATQLQAAVLTTKANVAPFLVHHP